MTADAQLQLADVELVDISVDDVQLAATEAPAGVGEARVPATIVDRYLAAGPIGSPLGRQPRVRGVSTPRSTAASRPGWPRSSVARRWSEISTRM